MDKIGIDVHKVATQVCVLTGTGEYAECRIRTEREALTALFGERPRARILLEAATESEWVARHLESLGHEVIVADRNFAPMYASRSRKVKTDKRMHERCATPATWARFARLTVPAMRAVCCASTFACARRWCRRARA